MLAVKIVKDANKSVYHEQSYSSWTETIKVCLTNQSMG